MGAVVTLILVIALVCMAVGTPFAFAWAIGYVVRTIGEAQERAVGALEQASATAARSILVPYAGPDGATPTPTPLPAAYDGVTYVQDDFTVPDGLDMTDAILPDPTWLRPTGVTVTDGSSEPFGIPGLKKDPERYAAR